MTPSSPAPSNRWNQSSARARSVVAGVRWTGGASTPASAASSRARRSPWGVARRSLVAEREQVPGDERRRRLGGEHLDPRRRRVDPEQQRLELELAVARDDDLAVEDAALRQRGLERLRELREVAVERLEVAATG